MLRHDGRGGVFRVGGLLMTPENKVREPVLKWAKTRGWGHQRMAFMRGVGVGFPDDMFFPPCTDGRPILIEFKRRGCVPTQRQADKINELRGLGYIVAWFDASETAIEFMRQYDR